MFKISVVTDQPQPALDKLNKGNTRLNGYAVYLASAMSTRNDLLNGKSFDEMEVDGPYSC